MRPNRVAAFVQQIANELFDTITNPVYTYKSAFWGVNNLVFGVMKMDYVKIMEQYLNLGDSDQDKVTDARARAASIASNAEDLYKFFQSKTDSEVRERIISDPVEIQEKLVPFILHLLYLCHDIGIKGESIEAKLYSEIIKECIEKGNDPVPRITVLK